MDLLDRIRISDSGLEEAAHPSAGDTALGGESIRMIRVNADPEGGLGNLLRRLQEYDALEANWDSYQSLPPSRVAMNQSLLLVDGLLRNGLTLPNVVVPTSGGGLQFEWSETAGELEVEILPEGGFVTLQTGDSDEIETEDLSLTDVLKLVEQFGAHAFAQSV